MNEDEVIRKLKQRPFEEVDKALFGLLTNEQRTIILKAHSWTPSEYLYERTKRLVYKNYNTYDWPQTDKG